MINPFFTDEKAEVAQLESGRGGLESGCVSRVCPLPQGAISLRLGGKVFLLSCGCSRPVAMHPSCIEGPQSRDCGKGLDRFGALQPLSPKKKESSSPLIPSLFLQSFSLSGCPQVLMEYLVCVFCSKEAAMIQTHEHHCPRGAFVAIDRDGLCGSLACITGAQCSLLNGRGFKGLGRGHMVSLGQSWDEEPQAAASCSRGLW